jgi:hypothetical protein
MNTLENGYLKKVEFPCQGSFHLFFVNSAEAQADTAIRTELARHGDQFAGDIFCFDDFFRPQGVADGFKEDDAEWVFQGHRRCLFLSESDDFEKSPDAALRFIIHRCGVFPSTPQGTGLNLSPCAACGAFYAATVLGSF